MSDVDPEEVKIFIKAIFEAQAKLTIELEKFRKKFPGVYREILNT